MMSLETVVGGQVANPVWPQAGSLADAVLRRWTAVNQCTADLGKAVGGPIDRNDAACEKMADEIRWTAPQGNGGGINE